MSASMDPTVRRSTTRPRKRKSKSVTFTGCWTCRSRKVKCDERQEDGCGVCQKSGLQCAGYGVNLCWVTGRKQDIQGLGRRQIRPDRPCLPGIRDDEINRLLSVIDTVSTPLHTVTEGPFGIFRADPALSQEADCVTAEEGSISECDSSTHTNTTSDDHNFSSQEAFGDTYRLSDLFSNDPIIQIAALDEAIFSSWDLSLSVSNSPSHINSHSTLGSSDLDPSPYRELPMPLVKDPNISLLLHHYQTRVADLLQPVFHDRNPWRTTYFPFALQGSPDSIMAQIPQAPSGVFSSLFHSLISAAAFHLRNLLDGSPKYHKIGLQHRAKALHALNTSIGLVTPARPEQYTVYITSMLALVTIDTITGEDSDFPVHLRGCRQLQKLQLNCQLIDGPARQVNSISQFLSLLTRTTTYDPEPRSPKIDCDVLKSIHFDVHDWSIEYMYGITPTLGNLLKRTCQTAERLSFYQGQNIPMPLLETCTAIENRLLSWNIDSETLHLMGPKEQTMREIVHCQARAFHSAIAIFYYRTIEPSRPVNLERYVETIWKNLKRAEDLKDEYLAGEKRAAPMSWPAFIAACEASDREPWVEWWERVQGYALGNFTRQWRTIREIWSIMDENKNVGSWREALRQSGKLVLPI